MKSSPDSKNGQDKPKKTPQNRENTISDAALEEVRLAAEEDIAALLGDLEDDAGDPLTDEEQSDMMHNSLSEVIGEDKEHHRPIESDPASNPTVVLGLSPEVAAAAAEIRKEKWGMAERRKRAAEPGLRHHLGMADENWTPPEIPVVDDGHSLDFNEYNG